VRDNDACENSSLAMADVAPLKAPALHAAARRWLDRPLADLGFARIRGARVAGWARPQGDRWLLLWFQPSRWNNAQSAGYRFTVELRLAARPELYALGRLARLPQLLSPVDRERLRKMENRVIARLPSPDPAVLRSLPDALRLMLLADLQPRLHPYAVDEHVWFRQAGVDDVDELLLFIRGVLPGAIERFIAGTPPDEAPPAAGPEPSRP
jgi:hypothetical protein